MKREKAKSIRILVVEDQKEHAELIRRVFEAKPRRVHLTVVPTLAAARAAVAAEVPDLVIADLVLPDGKGSELLANYENSFPIVIMTSHGDEASAVEAMKAGALHYVVKSIETVAGMPQIVESALREWRHLVERQRAEAALSFEASHDPLTSLYNRREFERRLERALWEAREEDATHAVCYLDLDQFKVINDSCGHLAGDMLLRQLGELLRSRLRKGDCLARLGGDEFGVLLSHCAEEDALHVAESFRRWITEFRFLWEEQIFNIGVSIGVVPITGDFGTVFHVLGAADRACYAAKDQGRNRIQFYHENDVDLKRRRGEMRWVTRIPRALDENRFRLDHQAIVPVRGAQPRIAYEVLIRLVDENGEMVVPGAFLPAAERYNLIGRLDRWVVETVLRKLAEHPEHLERLDFCSINLSARTVGDETFLAFCTEQFQETGVFPGKICFEITETMAIANVTQATRLMQSLKELGCRFALDDFGSGVSSFAYLKRLPVDFLKIDGLFVKDIVRDPIDAAVVSSVNEVAHAMGKQTIAEFVEDTAILEKLQTMGVDFAQGFCLGRPQPFVPDSELPGF